jgi:hypothetical protein
MTRADEEAEWRAEFERIGETWLRDELNYRSIPFPEPKRQFAFRWLREQEKTRHLRERRTYWFVKWTFIAAVAAVGVGIVGVGVTWWFAR